MLRALTDTTTLALQRALEGEAARQRTAANNLANLETPGYRPRRVEFQEQLRAALEAQGEEGAEGEAELLAAVRPEEVTYAGPALRRDGNAVDIETEMADLAESGLHYQAVIRLLAKKLQMLRSVATEGGK